jgi:tRNA dimethylallyltransferase
LEGKFTATLPERTPDADVVIIGLEIPREDLDARIGDRVQDMWDRGLVDEVVGLVAQGLADGVTASRALGYAQVLRMLADECTPDEAREQTITATRRFARRQLAWFRRDPRICWLPYDAPDLVDQAVERVVSTG